MVWLRGVCSGREFLGGVQDGGEVRIYGIFLSRMLKRLLWVSTHMHRVWECGAFFLISSSAGSFKLRRARKSFLL